MLQLLIVFAAVCTSKEVWGLKCVSERGANLSILLQDQDQWAIDAKTCYVRARYDIESDRVFMVEMYGMDDEPEHLGITVENETYFGTLDVNFACNKRDRCNNIKSFSKQMYIHRAKVPEDAKRINAITRGFTHQFKIGRRKERRLRRGVLYGIWAIVLVLCSALFLQFASGVTSYTIRSRPPRKKKKKNVRT